MFLFLILFVNTFNFFLLFFLMVCISLGEQVVVVVIMARENAGSPEAGVIQGRELPDVKTKTQTPILCKVNRCF